MTGTTLALTADQRAELRKYKNGEPRHADAKQRHKNLIRRDFLRLAPEAGRGFYRITPAGIAALGHRKDTMSASYEPPKRRHTLHDPSIGKRILEARTLRGLSQRELSGGTVFTAAYLSRVEKGERTPSVRAIRVWAERMKCSAAWLETGEDVVDVRMTMVAAAEICEWISHPSPESAWISHPSELLRALRKALGT